MDAPPKTGVLTFHRCINYGSYWQARHLVEGLRARGLDAELVDHDSRRVNLAEWQCALQPVLPTPVPPRDRALYAVKMLRFLAAFAALPRSRRFPLDRPDRMAPYDLAVVGSDEVWNLRHPWYGGCALFFGAGIPAPRLAAYAASFGNYDASEGLDAAWAARLRAFAAISVRDDNSRQIIRRALGVEPSLVLDPCLQFVRVPAARVSDGPWRGPAGRFALVYGHNFSPAFVSGVQRWARARGLPLVSIGYRNAWADKQWITAGPHDFARAFTRAEAVATNFFHGCVFALRHARPFVCETSFYRSTKVRNLMTAVGGEAHLVTDGSPDETYAGCLDRPPDRQILHNIHCLRLESDAFLDRALAARDTSAALDEPPLRYAA